jgi:hypothetical protein
VENETAVEVLFVCLLDGLVTVVQDPGNRAAGDGLSFVSLAAVSDTLPYRASSCRRTAASDLCGGAARVAVRATQRQHWGQRRDVFGRFL